MSYHFGSKSKEVLETCDSELVEICHTAIEVINFSVLSGARTKEQQNFLYAQGRTMPGPIVTWVDYPNSKHNIGEEAGRDKSAAIDLAPWPIDWNDIGRFKVLGGVMLGIAKEKEIGLRWGADWDMDMIFDDQQRFDWGHFELVE